MKSQFKLNPITPRLAWLLLAAALPSATTLLAQPFSSGSTGSYGAMNITTNTTLALPADGIFNCTTITVASNATLTFTRNALNTPVYLLAQSNILIQGSINLNGSLGTITAGGAGGPGGFDGGPSGQFGFSPGPGQGPGAARVVTNESVAGNASFGAVGIQPYGGGQPPAGPIYGNALLMPLVGGSGGGGNVSPQFSGGGGGGAILVASSTEISLLTGTIIARGRGASADGVNEQSQGGCGSGGGVRLLAPVVRTGATRVDVGSAFNYGGAGRVRIDTTDRRFIDGNTAGGAPFTVGANMASFPNPLPKLSIVEAAGTVIAEGSGAPVQIQLPFGSTTNRTVTVLARDFNSSVNVDVVLIPESGAAVKYQTTIDNLSANPASNVVNVVVPVNTVVNVKAWTR